MIKETRTIHYDAELAIEAYWLQNVLEPFPDHFHDYYLIGFIEKGARELTCGGQKYITTEGDLFTLNPHEPHGCRSYDGKPFSYRGIGVLPDVMRAAMREITGQAILPRFRERILSQSELACSLRDLHAMIVQEDKEFRKEEIFLMLLGQLLRDNAGETPLPDAYKDESDIVPKIVGRARQRFVLLRHMKTSTTRGYDNGFCALHRQEDRAWPRRY